ncbi:primosomal protein N' [Nocardioides sp.]|uniref:primosomal protein N' n=1 Tax=Nocardioides sp. TaxID=35761 RepID=UPI001A348D73|nr:primosomal protein N' [Nocardioides sp.]MBJ7357992.1 primosomal protein N' [Nocardioides sp.]
MTAPDRAPRAHAGEQPELLPGLVRAEVARARKATATRARKAAEAPLAEHDPVARVLVDLPLAHLDRAFDYAVPAAMAEAARPGVRVKVRFAGQDVDGFLVERRATSDHTGALHPLRRVVSPEPVLTPAVAGLCEDVARRYAGTRSDVLRLAVPPRHATVEKEDPEPVARPVELDLAAAEQAWAGYAAAPAYLRHLADGGAPRAVWASGPGTDWPALVAHAVAVTRAAGKGALVVVPDHADVARVDTALTGLLGPGQHVVLTADAGPARRYREFLAVVRDGRRVVVGTRAAAFAPVHDLGLLVIWDDGDDLYAEPRAPYPHAREVLLTRAEREGTAMLLGGFARSVEAQQLLRTGWAQPLALARGELRTRARIEIAGADDHSLDRDPLARAARLPSQVHRLVRDALEAGPVLVQNPRAGYVTSLACVRCRTPARCGVCRGPLDLTSATAAPSCRWCGTAAEGWSCPECGDRGLRAPVVGEARTAEELGRAFPGVVVRMSAGEHVLTDVESAAAIVVATPGAEPVAAGGYAAVVLLDTWLALGVDHLRAEEEALRRWSNAVGLLRPGGRAIAVGDPGHPALQALVRWDHAGFAEREAESRREAHLPPASRLATLTGEVGAVDDVLTLLDRPEGTEVLGPTPVPGADPERVRAVVRVPRIHGLALSDALGELQRLRSARKLDPVRIQVDPPTL